MGNSFGDARIEEFQLLSRLEKQQGYSADNDVLIPGPRKDMIVHLIREGHVNDLDIHWQHTGMDAFLGLPGESVLERQLNASKLCSLSTALAGQYINLNISHKGRVRLSELRQALQSGRIRDAFGILWDQRHVYTDLLIAMTRADATNPLSLVFIDMNGLKQINDENGHQAGDEAIKIFLQTVLATTSGIGEAYRNGGDEAIVIMPATTAEQALEAAEVCANALMTEKISVNEHLLSPLTVSIGIAPFLARDEDPNDFKHRADETMYRAKERGKDCLPRPCTIAVDGGKNEVVVLDLPAA